MGTSAGKLDVSSRINLNFVNKYVCIVRSYKLDRNEGKSFLRRGQAKVLSKTVKYRVEARIPSSYFDDCFLPLIFYVYISKTAAGPRNKSW